MRKFWACSTSVLIAVAGAPVMAQTDDGVDALQLEEIVVTAEKRETDLQKTAISIQVYSGEELKKEGKKRIDEIMDGVVGVQSQGSQVGTDFYMRGVGNVGGMGGGERAVAVLIDGVYQNRSETVRGGTLDVAQVEVMRGTQSTNLGASSLAGAVSLVSNQPVFEYQASGTVEVGNYHKLGTEGVLNVPLADNQALRFAFSTEKRNGYISSGAGDSDQTNARAKYRIKASDDLDMVFTLNHQNIGGNGVSDGVLLYSGHWESYVASNYNGLVDANGDGYTVDADGNVTDEDGNDVTDDVDPDDYSVDYGLFANGSCSPTTPDGVLATMGCPALFVAVDDGVAYYDRDNPWDDGYPADAWPNNPFRDTNIDTFSADINWTTGIGTLTVKPSYQQAHFRSTEPPRGTSFRQEDQRQKTAQLDTQLASSGDSTLTWLAGAYYYYTTTDATFKTVVFPGASGMDSCDADGNYCYSWQGTDGAYTRTMSAYGNVSYPLLDTLRLTGGLRYSRDTKYVNSSDDATGTATGPSSAYVYDNSNEHTWSATTFSAGVEYDIFAESMLYGKYATGYQPGSVSDSSFTKAQEIEQITLGLKNRFFGNTLQLNLELFSSTYHNRSLQGGLTVSVDEDATLTEQCRATGDAIMAITSADDGSTTGYNTLCFADGYPLVDDYLSRGVDMEVSWLPTSNDRFDVSVEYLKATQTAPNVSMVTVDALTDLGVTDSAYAATMVAKVKDEADAYDGLPTQNSPEWSGNLTYSHNFNFSGGSVLTPKLNAAYKSEYWSASGPNANATTAMDHTSALWQDAYVMYNAYLTWQNADGKFSVNSYVKNIANKAVMTNYGGTYVTLDAPRTYGVSVNANF